MLGSGATVLALSQARPLWLIVALSAVAGLFAELYRAAAAAVIADLVEPARRVTAFAAYRLGSTPAPLRAQRRPDFSQPARSRSSSLATPSRRSRSE